MVYSKTGQHLTQSFEQCRLVPYLDSKGVPTDGWGNTHGVVMGVAITQEKADAQFVSNMAEAVGAVNRYVKVALSQNEFDSLVDLVFNIGSGNFYTSTLLKKLNAGDKHGASMEFEKWDMCGGVHNAGLLKRRILDEFLFNTPGG
jgi:lysozyme